MNSVFKKKKNILVFVSLAMIIIIAFLLRFYGLSFIPPGLYPDEAANGLSALNILDGNHGVYFPENGGREGMYYYILALFINIFGRSILALRAASALIGSVTIFFVYLLGKELWDRRVGSVASFFLAVSHWHIIISRDVFRAILVPMVLAIVFYFLVKAFKTKKPIHFILSGIFIALGFYTYPGYQGIVFLFIFLLAYFLLFKRKYLLKNIKNIGLGFLSFVIVFAPMLVFIIQNPGTYFGRSAGVSIFSAEVAEVFGGFFGALWNNIVKSALMFNFSGDMNPRHNIPGIPMLDYIVGILFVIGLVYSVLRFYKIRNLVSLSAIGVFLIPQLMSVEGIPHGLRTLGILPFVMIIAALPIVYLFEKIKNLKWKRIYLGIVLLIFVLITYGTVEKTFIHYPSIPDVHYEYSEDLVAISEYINSSSEKYTLIFDEYYGYSIQTIQYLVSDSSKYNLVEVWKIGEYDFDGENVIVAVNGRGFFDQIKSEYEVSDIYKAKGKFGNDLFDIYKLEKL